MDPPPHEDPDAPLTDGERYLEVAAQGALPVSVPSGSQRPDPARVLHALASEDRPLLAALWPGRDDILREPPTAEQFDARITQTNLLLNQISRRSGEWRARAEVASAALSRRLGRLGADGALYDAAIDEMRRFVFAEYEARVRAAAGSEAVLYGRERRRFREEAARTGLGEDAFERVCERHRIQAQEAELPVWTELNALPGAPREIDAVAEALLRSPAQGLVAVRDGAVLAWLRSNGARESVLAESAAAQALANEADQGAVAVHKQAWALGRKAVAVGAHWFESPEEMLLAIRSARVQPSQIANDARVLEAWFRALALDAAAAACERIRAGDPRGIDRLRWALGDPLRLGGRSVPDASVLARDVLARDAARRDALEFFRDGTLVAWLGAQPLLRRDPRWLDELSADAVEGTPSELRFWRGVYRQVARAPLRISVAPEKYVRFATPTDLLVTAHLAAVWEPLKRIARSGELLAWLEAMAPGLTFAPPSDESDDDAALNELLWQLGHRGLVLPWGRVGFAVHAPKDVVRAYTQNAARLDAVLDRLTAWAYLERFHGEQRLGDVPLRTLVPALRERTRSTAPGVRALTLALACGLDVLPLDPARPVGAEGVRGYASITPGARDEAAWSKLEVAFANGTASLWAVRQLPALATRASEIVLGAGDATALRAALIEAGTPVVSAALAAEIDAERRAAEQQAARAKAEEEAQRLAMAAQLATARAAEREAERRAIEEEAARLAAEAKLAAARVSQRLLAEREATRLALARAAAEREAERIAQIRLDERESALREAERIAKEREALRVAAEREVAQLADERARAEQERERLADERKAGEREVDALSERRRAAEEEAAKLAEQRVAAEREAARLASARAEAERQAALHAVELERLAQRRVHAEHEATERAVERLVQEQLAEYPPLESNSPMPGVASVPPPDQAPAAAAPIPIESPNTPLEETVDAVADAGLAVFDDADAPAPETAALVDAGESVFALPDRHEIDTAALADATAVHDPVVEARVRTALDAWAIARGEHPYRDLGARAAIRSLEASPVFSVVLNSRIEQRRLEDDSDERARADTVNATVDRSGRLDPWSATLPDVDTWSTWEARYGVNEPERTERCGACEGRGRRACDKCGGREPKPCANCGGRATQRCAPCAGTGEVSAGRGTQRCAACDGRGTTRCTQCRGGYVICAACGGEKDVACTGCGGRGERRVRRAIVQSYAPTAALEIVRGAVPERVAAQAESQALGPVPVALLEAPELDPLAVSREIGNPALAAVVAGLITHDAALLHDDARIARQRLIVRRYEVVHVRYRIDDIERDAWVHGPADAVHAPDSPIEAWLGSSVKGARAAMERGELEVALDALSRLDAIANGDAAYGETALALCREIAALGSRGEHVRARDLSQRAARLHADGCADALREAERVIAARLGRSADWILVERAEKAFEANRSDRAFAALTELARATPGHADLPRLIMRAEDVTRAAIRDAQWSVARSLLARLEPLPAAASAVASLRKDLDGSIRPIHRRALVRATAMVLALAIAIPIARHALWAASLGVLVAAAAGAFYSTRRLARTDDAPALARLTVVWTVVPALVAAAVLAPLLWR